MRVRRTTSLALTGTLFVVTTMVALNVASTASEPVQNDDCACTETYGDCCEGGCGGGYGGGHAGCCSMPPHYMYFPQSHGNYYFRPYNYQTILQQQQSVGRYGGDRRNPYDNSLFLPLYDEVNSSESRDEEIVVPNPLSAAAVKPARQIKPASTLLRDEAPFPPQVHIEPVVTELVRAKSSSSAFRLRMTAEKD